MSSHPEPRPQAALGLPEAEESPSAGPSAGGDLPTLRATRDRLEQESRVLEEEIGRLQVRVDALLEKWCSVDKLLHKAEALRYDKLKMKAIQASYTYRITAFVLRLMAVPANVVLRLTKRI